VLVLLDACHSGAVSNVEPDLDKLSKGLAASNVSVLTSSSSKEISREDPAWQNGAFTKVLMEALGRDADENHDGLVSMTELAHYMSTHLPAMTANHQHWGWKCVLRAISSSLVCEARTAGDRCSNLFERDRILEPYDAFACVRSAAQWERSSRCTSLGRVDGFDQDEGARKRDEGGEVLRGLLAA
jgi:hypothetical protein